MLNTNNILEIDFDVNQHQQSFLDLVQDSSFPYYFQESTSNIKIFAHGLMSRNKDDLPVRGNQNSDYSVFAESIFMNFCNQNDIKVKTVLRMAFNCSPHAKHEHNGIHIDHKGFEHWNFLLYLNDCSGDTLLFDKNNNIIKRISPKKNKALVFNSQPHANQPCASDEWRFVFVVTFIIENEVK